MNKEKNTKRIEELKGKIKEIEEQVARNMIKHGLRAQNTTSALPLVLDDEPSGSVILKLGYGLETTKPMEDIAEIPIAENKYYSVAQDIRALVEFFPRIVKFNLSVRERYPAKLGQADALFSSLFLFCPLSTIPNFQTDLTSLGSIIASQADGLFEQIRKDGPLVLCNPDVQELMEDWFSDNAVETVTQKLSKLNDAFLEYAFGVPFSGGKRVGEGKVKIRRGRPRADIIERIGTEGVIITFKMYTAVFKYMKKAVKEQRPKDAKSIFDKEWKGLLEFLKQPAQALGLHEFFADVQGYLNRDLNPFHWLSTFIDDGHLREYFLKAKWEPHKFTKTIVSEILSVSESKLDKVIYSKP